MSETKTEREIRIYIEMRDKVSAEEKKFKKFKADLQDKMAAIAAHITTTIGELGGDSLKTGAGTAFMSTVTRTSIDNWDKFTKYVANEILKDYGITDKQERERLLKTSTPSDVFAFFNKSVNKMTVLQFMSDNEQALPPGVKYDATKELKINKPTKKKT